MKATKIESDKKVDQSIRLVDGEFTPSEACDIVNSLLDEKINFHKLQRLTIWEGNVNGNCSFPNNRIEELMREKEIAREFFKLAREKGAMLKIKGNLEIELIR